MMDQLKNLSNNKMHNLIIELKNQLDEKDSELDKLYNTLHNVSKVVSDVIDKDYQIQMSKKELELIFDATEDYIVVLDKDHLIRRVNSHFCNLVGKNHKEIIGTTFMSYFPDLPKNFQEMCIPEDRFIRTTFFSSLYNKHLLIKSRKLNKNEDPLVYIHITKDIR